MKPIENYDKINEAGEFKPIPKGIYLVQFTKVVDVPEKECLEIYCDVVKGEYKNYFKSLTEAGLKDSSRSFRSYKMNALPFFKAFITAIEKSNPGYHWDWDETKIVGKCAVAVIGEEEYEDNEGNIKVGTRITEFRSIEAAKEGRIKIPELKKLPPKPEPVVEPVGNNLPEISDDELPF